MKDKLDETSMKLIGEMLKSVMPPGWGFTLLTFELDKPATMVHYISTAERQSLIGTMETMLQKFKNIPDPNMN